MYNRNLIRFDWAIKRLLRNKADYFVLEGFLSELLIEDISIQSILESESNQRIDTDKFNRVDLLVKDSKGELIIIERIEERCNRSIIKFQSSPSLFDALMPFAFRTWFRGWPQPVRQCLSPEHPRIGQCSFYTWGTK